MLPLQESIWVIAATVTVTATETATIVTLIAIPTATGITVAVVTAIEIVTTMAETGPTETETGAIAAALLLAPGTLPIANTSAGGALPDLPLLAALPGSMKPPLRLQPTATLLVGKGFIPDLAFSMLSPFYVIFVIFLTQ
jgi:hypothetical protein